MRTMRSSPARSAFVAASILAVLATGALVWQGNSVAQEKRTGATPAELEHANSLSRAFRAAAETTMPTVVTIISEAKPVAVTQNAPRGQGGENPFKGTPFEDFFDGEHGAPFRQTPNVPRSGMGAGVIIDPAGLILTNNHVVEGADSIRVRLSDGREFEAQDVKADPKSDLAVVKIEAGSPLPAAKIGDSDAMSIGDWVIAVGNPFNQEQTVSAGIVSGKGRTLGADSRTGYIQTDAAINPGNSGGPLVNLNGEVVGINTAIASRNGGFQGLGFAIPMNQAKWVMGQLIDQGFVQRAYLGVQVGEVVGDVAHNLGLNRYDGLLVGEVVPDSPASKAGFEAGDIITEYNGHHVRTPRELQEVVERTPVDKTMNVKIFRNGEEKTLAVTVKPLPKEIDETAAPAESSAKKAEGYSASKFGLDVADMTPEAAKEMGFEGHEGVVISDVNANGIAAQKGLESGMLIMKVGNTWVKTVAEFREALEKNYTADNGVLVLVRTDGGNRFVVLKE